MIVSSYTKLKVLVREAIRKYGKHNIKHPVWFPYGRLESKHESIQKYPTFASLLGITDAALNELVSTRSFSSLRHHFLNQFKTRNENQDIFIMISDDLQLTEKEGGSISPLDQYKSKDPLRGLSTS